MLFEATGNAGEDLAETTEFILENVNWSGELRRPTPRKHPVVDAHLEAVCAGSGPPGSSSHALAQALLTVADQLEWRSSSRNPEDGPDVVAFAPSFTAATLIGATGVLPSGKVLAGFSLQGRDTYYPPHAHLAEESYWIIGGSGDWRVGAKPWFAVEPGDSIYHAPWARHAMQTNEQAMLTVWLWTSHLDSEVVIVRE